MQKPVSQLCAMRMTIKHVLTDCCEDKRVARYINISANLYQMRCPMYIKHYIIDQIVEKYLLNYIIKYNTSLQ